MMVATQIQAQTDDVEIRLWMFVDAVSSHHSQAFKTFLKYCKFLDVSQFLRFIYNQRLSCPFLQSWKQIGYTLRSSTHR